MSNVEEFLTENSQKNAAERRLNWLEDRSECLQRVRDEIMQSPSSNPVTQAVYQILQEYGLVP